MTLRGSTGLPHMFYNNALAEDLHFLRWYYYAIRWFVTSSSTNLEIGVQAVDVSSKSVSDNDTLIC